MGAFINSLKRPFVNTDYGYGNWGTKYDTNPDGSLKYPPKQPFREFQVGETVHWKPTPKETEKYGLKRTIFGNSKSYSCYHQKY